jgi:putative salt-induced outer membrane protein YdiY
MSRLQLPLLLLTFSLCAHASAVESAISVKKDYDLDADLSYLLNNSSESGAPSTKQQSVAGHLDYKRMMGTWGQELKAEGVGSNSNNSVDNVERYLVAGKMMHSENTGYYEFAKLQWEKDRGSSFDSQTALTLGLGSVLYRDEVQLLNGELGLGARYDIDRIPPHNSTTEAIATVAAHYERKLTPTVNASLDLGDDYGSGSNTARAHAELSMTISEHLSGLFSYDYKQIDAKIGDSRAALTSFGIKYSH